AAARGASPAALSWRDYFFASFAAARLTASSLILPVLFLIAARVVLGENWGMGFDRFLLSVSPRLR
ncbi:MAG: hypothetical protein WAN05_15030, partial [Roseiarcus sp.]